MIKAKYSIAALVIIVALSTAPLQVAYSADNNTGELIVRSLQLLKRLQYLESRHVNVTGLVDEVNTALQLAQKGNTGEAEKILSNVEAEVSKLEPQAETHYKMYIAVKTLEVTVVLSIPILFYYGFPRLYLYTWFRLRRRWQVRDGSTRR